MRYHRVMLLLAVLFLSPNQARAQPPPGELARQILRDPAYQKDMAPRLARPSAIDGDESSGLRSRRPNSARGPGAGSLANLLAWIGVGVALALALILVAASLRRRQSDAQPAAARDGLSPPDEPGPDPSLAAVNQLAADGRFAEAVHELLLLAVGRLAARRGQTIFAWLTSRELTGVLPATEQERGSFARLVASVERSLFGGQPVVQDDYQRCLRDFAELDRGARPGPAEPPR